MNDRTPSLGPLLAIALALASSVLQAGTPVPLLLPRPDGQAGNPKKPVKVYLLAGQSNMVGMGNISGARPLYPSIFLCADPVIIPGEMPVGSAGLRSHGVYESAEAGAARGAKASVYAGDYEPTTDYSKRTPVTTATVALGTTAARLPSVDGPYTVVASAAIDVPVAGTYTLHVGFEASSHARATLDGKEVYRKEPGGKPAIAKVALEAGKRYPLVITYLDGASLRQARGGSAAFWLQQVDVDPRGDLEIVTGKERKFPYLLDESGKWSVRNDVTYTDPRLFPERAASPLSAMSNNGKTIGPELGFGHVMGTFHDEQALLIKTAMGNRALGFDFRPPSSGRNAPTNNFESLEYKLMVEGVRKTLDNISSLVPGYAGQGYEIAGFGWFQGHKDSFSDDLIAEYEKTLVNLVNDLRQEFKVPRMPVVVATVGFGGYRMSEKFTKIWQAQMAVGDPGKHPEFAGTVASVDTRDFWREAEESPQSEDYHYNRNAETYLLVGEAMGRAMVELMGGKAAPIPLSGRQEKAAAQAAAPTADPTEREKAASLMAIRPLILDGVLADFMANPANKIAVQIAARSRKPARGSQFLRDTLDSLVAVYEAAGIHDYGWKPFGPDLNHTTWDYFCFDPPQALDKAKGAGRYRKVTYPAGMENWFAPAFDAAKAGWKQGLPPFGQKDGQLEPLGNCTNNFCLCGVPPRTLWDKEVLLIRGTFDIPPLKEGYRYRLVVGGSDHVMSGEGYALYANGRLLAESKDGVPNRAGGQPRGGHVCDDLTREFSGGKVTLAAMSFLQYTRKGKEIPPRGHLSVWMEEQKIPPVE